MKILSICTPTYNRAYTLERLYRSLLVQNDTNFEWVVIDDGSTDETSELISRFIKEDKITIIYEYHSNRGKHMSLNKAYEIANFDYIFCLDSDDWIVDDAVEVINKDYKDIIKHDNDLIGAVYLDKFVDGEIIGSRLPNKKKINWITLKHKDNMTGDKCYVFKKDALLKYPFITFKNNRHMPPTYQFYLMSQNKKIYTIDMPLKIVEYLEDGITNSVKTNYFKAAENYAYYRKQIHPLLPSVTDKVKNIILYNISYINSNKNKNLQIKGVKTRVLSLILLPISYFLSFYYKNIKRII